MIQNCQIRNQRVVVTTIVDSSNAQTRESVAIRLKIRVLAVRSRVWGTSCADGLRARCPMISGEIKAFSISCREAFQDVWDVVQVNRELSSRHTTQRREANKEAADVCLVLRNDKATVFGHTGRQLFC